MLFNDLRNEFLRPNIGRALGVFIAAHAVSLAACMVYPIIMFLVEYSDERLMSDQISNFQHFLDSLTETFALFVFYSLPPFLAALGLYLSKFFYDRAEFRKITYGITFIVMFATLHLDTGLDMAGHATIYGTAALYVIVLFTTVTYFGKRCGTKK